jgi:hypothetical protein
MKSSQLQKEALLERQKLAAARSPDNREPDAECSIWAKDEWSQAKWLLLSVVVLALGLRIWGIDFGLPYELTNDEGKEILRALKLGAGEYYWGFGKGGLYYILFLEYVFLYAYWWIIGRVANGTDFAVQFIRDPSMFFLMGRVTVATMGALTCVVVFHVGRRLYDWRIGLGAAFIGATAYTHAVQSHFVSVDVGMTLAMWGSILAYLKYEQTSNHRWLAIAGMLAGLAIAFKLPGAVVLPVLFLAIASRADAWHKPRLVIKDLVVVLLTTIATLTIVAPEWIFGIGASLNPYHWLLDGKVTQTDILESDAQEAFRFVTTRRGANWSGYVRTLFQEHNLALTLAALAGVGLAVARKQRWSMIWAGTILLFVGIMSASNRGQPEHYLLPIGPCLWLLASQALVAIPARRWLTIAALLCVVALPLIAIVRQNTEWTKPDTRIVAKQWIESNVPPGAKILMDGYQHRFTPSPPLLPDKSAVLRQVSGVASEPNRFRGVSQRTLKLYAQAMESIEGPRYELHSTRWGLAVEEPSTYVQRCFDYIITSSMITKRYKRENVEQRLPKSAKFYDQLDELSYLQKIYTIEPIPWQRSGPTIDVYKIIPTCTATKKSTTSLSQR